MKCWIADLKKVAMAVLHSQGSNRVCLGLSKMVLVVDFSLQFDLAISLFDFCLPEHFT